MQIVDFFRNWLCLKKIMIFECLSQQILSAYACIWTKNLLGKTPKRAIFSSKWNFEKSLMPVFIFCTFLFNLCATQVKPGIEQLFENPYIELLYEKKIGLITNQTGIDSRSNSTISLLQKNATSGHYTLNALFGPEHGLFGIEHAGEHVNGEKHRDQIPIYSLYNKNHRPTKEMLEKVDVLVFDIQDIGCRSYTYTTTLFYIM